MDREEGILWKNNLYFHPFQWAFFDIRMESTCVESSFCCFGELSQSLNH